MRPVRTRFMLAALAGALLLLCCSPAPAQAGSSALRSLRGGTLACRTELSLGFLYGAGSRPGALGAAVATLRSGPTSATSNPAGLAFLESNALVIDAVPGLGVPLAEFLDAEGRAATAIDDAISDVAADDIALAYPSLDVWAGQQGGVLSGLAAVRIGRVAAAAAFEEPLALDLSFVDTGIEAFAEAVKSEGSGDVDIIARCFLDAAGRISASISRTTLATAAEVAPTIGVGVSVSHYRAEASLAGTVRGDGIVDYGGQEYAFNDPSDPWHNELGADARGAFSGSGIGWTAGASWRPSGWLALDAVCCSAPELRLSGSLTVVENMIPAVSGDGVDVEMIAASQPTFTEETTTVHDGPLGLTLPSYAGAALTTRLGPVLATVEYRAYTSGLAYSHEGRSEGIDLRDGVGLGLDVGGLWAGGGVVRGELRSSDGGQETDDIAIPFVNVGFGVRLGQNINLDTLILAVPVQVLRLSLAYEF
ncbi:MAG: hypothetical protein FJY74_06425 [Candidatus Eisenbacteria bacterium]|nr:hypothetical protein [Candidatus Eisenbacteria bacterium]